MLTTDATQSENLTTAVNKIASSIEKLAAAQEQLATALERVAKITDIFSKLMLKDLTEDFKGMETIEEIGEFADLRHDEDLDRLRKNIELDR